MIEKGWVRKKILDFYRFLDELLALPKELALEYNTQVKKIEEELKVSYITTAERIGLEQGRVEGRNEGLVEGRNEGRLEGESLVLMSILEYKFKCIPNKYLELIRSADESKLLHWNRRVIAAENLEDVFIDG